MRTVHEPTEDVVVWERLSGFTVDEIRLVAQSAGVDEATVHRIVDCIRLVKKDAQELPSCAPARSERCKCHGSNVRHDPPLK